MATTAYYCVNPGSFTNWMTEIINDGDTYTNAHVLDDSHFVIGSGGVNEELSTIAVNGESIGASDLILVKLSPTDIEDHRRWIKILNQCADVLAASDYSANETALWGFVPPHVDYTDGDVSWEAGTDQTLLFYMNHQNANWRPRFFQDAMHYLELSRLYYEGVASRFDHLCPDCTSFSTTNFVSSRRNYETLYQLRVRWPSASVIPYFAGGSLGSHLADDVGYFFGEARHKGWISGICLANETYSADTTFLDNYKTQATAV